MNFAEAHADLARRRGIARDEHAVRGVLVHQVFEVIEERLGRQVARSCRPTLRDRETW